ncbi:MAG: hypothetical protein GY832_14590 [Chloroflexi bacterium]|nr:hypothetical protein [Chloroflexota bacterium]
MRTLYISRLSFALALLALSLSTAWTPLPQTDEISVFGQVTNGTTDGVIPADLPITLHLFSGMEEVGTYTTTLSADNTFYFDGLTPEVGDIVVARTVYQDVTYASEFVTFEPEQQEISLPVIIYETTDDPAEVQITQMHVFISGGGDRIQVGEYCLINNTGDRTYVGVEGTDTGQRTTLNFALPDGAEELHFDDPGSEERFLEYAGGFTDTEPIPPGNATTEVLFSYQLLYQEGMQIERTFEVPVTSVVILISVEGLALEGNMIVPGESMNTQMGQALSYTAGPLAVGEVLNFALVAQPETMMPPSALPDSTLPLSTTQESSIGLVVLAVAVAVIYWLWQSPKTLETLPLQARSLIETIAALDADFEVGQVEEGSYLKKRQSLKQQLRRLMKEEE